MATSQQQTASDAFVVSVQNMIEQLRLASNDPADAIRILTGLADYDAIALPPAVINSTDPSTPSLAQSAASMCRRAVLSSLARATGAYRPTSSNDAAAVLSAITPLYDAEIAFAGDIGDDTSFQQLRSLRAVVITDLQTRGATLPQLIQISFNASLPSFTVAQMQYSDGSRSDDIISRVDPPCPLFLPLSMTLLNS